MKLADLKRIPVGTKLRLVHCLMGPCDKPREVLKVQTNAVVMLTPEGKHSWLTLPKASDFRDDWGGGPDSPPVFCAWDDEGHVFYTRAHSREAAKDLLLQHCPLRFYR
jgi:hypothetical protein